MSQQPGQKKFPGGKTPRPSRVGSDEPAAPEKPRRTRTPRPPEGAPPSEPPRRASIPKAAPAARPDSTPKPATRRPSTPKSEPKAESKPKSKPRPSSRPARSAAPVTPPTPEPIFVRIGPLVVRLGSRLVRQPRTLAWIGVLAIALLILPRLLWPGPSVSGVIAPLFAREVHYWEADIARWAEQYGVDPNLIATLMQIESCGHPDVASSAGAQGLFQVMPMHFVGDETLRMTDPETNALRGMGVILDCLQRAGGDFGLAMACYNGGPRRIGQPMDQWPAETQRYYRWGSGIYADALRNAESSATLNAWYAAGGWGLCQRASGALGLATSTPYMSPVEFLTPTLPILIPAEVPAATISGPTPHLPDWQAGDDVVPTAPAPGALPTFSGFGG